MCKPKSPPVKRQNQASKSDGNNNDNLNNQNNNNFTCESKNERGQNADPSVHTENGGVSVKRENENASCTPGSNNLQKAKQNLEKGTLYASISVALLIAAFSLTMPYLQSRRDALSCDSLCLGSMTSARSTLSLIGSALMGRLSDNKVYGGRRTCLYVGTAASLLGLVIAATTYSIRGLWWSMVPGALLQQNFSVFKALLADYHQDIEICITKSSKSCNKDSSRRDDNSKERDNARAGSVGKLGMSVGLAFMVGPLAGATIVKTYEAAVGLAMVFTIASAFFISKMPFVLSTNINNSTTANVTKQSKIQPDRNSRSILNTISHLFDVKAARSPSALFLMAIRVSMALAFHIFNTIWTVSLKKRFEFGPKQHGMFMSFIGLTYALSQGVLAKLILSPLGKRGRIRMLQLCCFALGVGRYVAFQTNSLIAVYIMFGFIITALGLVNTILTADTSRIAPSEEIGGLYGVLEAVQNAAGMVGPVLGGALGSIWDPIHAPLCAVVGLYAFVFLLVLFGYERFMCSSRHEAVNNPGMTDGIDGTGIEKPRKFQDEKKESLKLVNNRVVNENHLVDCSQQQSNVESGEEKGVLTTEVPSDTSEKLKHV